MLIRLPQVQEIYPKSKSSIYAEMAKGTFPKSVPIGPRAVAWNLEEVQAKVNEIIAEADDRTLIVVHQAAEEMGILVDDLMLFIKSGALPTITIGKNVMIRRTVMADFQKRYDEIPAQGHTA